jgi:hypothetical protein
MQRDPWQADHWEGVSWYWKEGPVLVQKGWFSSGTLSLHMRFKKGDSPMLGRPTMPVLTWLPGRSSRGSSPPRSSCTAGLTFLTWKAEGYTTPPATAALLTDPLGWFRQHLVVVGAGLVGCLLVGFQMAILYVAAQPRNRLRSCTVTAFEPLCCKLVVSDESPQPHSACDWVRFVPPSLQIQWEQPH